MWRQSQKSKELSTIKNLLCNVKGPWMLVELELNNSEKECLFLRMK